MTFSILIPTWNNLGFLKLCIESVQKNSHFTHQIIVHINEGSDGTLEWVKSQGFDYTYSTRNIGVCLAMNMMRSRVKTDYICFLNDDMYVCPDWDLALANEIEALGHKFFFLSSSLIEPRSVVGNVVKDYGVSPDTFREASLLEEYQTIELADWAGATSPPNVVHRDIWDLVGGYSVELSPGMYSDPDFSAKLWFCGVRYFKGLSGSRVYHFGMKSTGRIIKNNGTAQFLNKWGLVNSSFRNFYTRKGMKWSDAEQTPHPLQIPLKYRIKAKLKMLYYLLTSDVSCKLPLTNDRPFNDDFASGKDGKNQVP